MSVLCKTSRKLGFYEIIKVQTHHKAISESNMQIFSSTLTYSRSNLNMYICRPQCREGGCEHAYVSTNLLRTCRVRVMEIGLTVLIMTFNIQRLRLEYTMPAISPILSIQKSCLKQKHWVAAIKTDPTS